MNARHAVAELVCSQDQFEALHDELDKTRRTSKTVKVDRAALQALLMDHSKLVNIAERTH
jgi:hypothetical protein